MVVKLDSFCPTGMTYGRVILSEVTLGWKRATVYKYGRVLLNKTDAQAELQMAGLMPPITIIGESI